MPLPPHIKAERARNKLLDKAKEYSLGTYSNKFVAPVFQKMIRAEDAAMPDGETTVIVNGTLCQVFRVVGQCACVTCGAVASWKGNSIGGGVIESGHFIASRRASVLYEATNCHPQCKNCNRHLSGNHGVYEMWMRAVYGQDEIDRLRRLKNSNVTFDREQLVDMRIEFKRRLDAAIERMSQ